MTPEELKIIEQIDQELLDKRIAEKYAAKLELIASITEEAPETKETRETEKSEKVRKKYTRSVNTAQVMPVWKELLFLLIKIVSIIIIFILLFTFLYGIIRYDEPAMSPMIKDGDLVLYYRYTKSGYMPQDAVVLDFQGKRQVRRVVAKAGDTVDITEAGLIVNGAIQQEPEIYQKTERYEEGIEFPLIVPEGYVFVLGDSRTGATDSRIYGCVKIEDTYGKVMGVIRRRSI